MSTLLMVPYLHNHLLSGLNPTALLLSPTRSPCYSEMANGNWWVGKFSPVSILSHDFC
jgi:hypothetical protein